MGTGEMLALFGAEDGTQKEVTPGLTRVITFLWSKFPNFPKNETSAVIGKIARRGF
jgi:hypothetical protein